MSAVPAVFHNSQPIYEYSLTRTPTLFIAEEYRAISPTEAAEYLDRLNLNAAEQESLVVLTLNSKNRVTGHYIATRGLLDRSQAHPREIFRLAILAGAARIIIGHNHPSGDSAPSKADLEITKNLVEAGEIIGIPVVDHIVIGNAPRDYTSLREQRLI